MKPIGIIYTPFTNLENMPIQPAGAEQIKGVIKLDDQYTDGLRDLEGFSHIWLLYRFHKVKKSVLRVTPFLDTEEKGVFATRSPLRPNPIGISLVRLISITGNEIVVQGVDILNDTPLLDIKPYIEKFDFVPGSLSGWMTKNSDQISAQRSDGRFVQ